jgi:hypothetical protein
MAETSRSGLRRLMNRVGRWWKKEPDLPGDPFANRMVPVRPGPKGRSGAAAVAEPEEDGGGYFPPRR